MWLELRAALCGMQATEGSVLHAVYHSASTDLVDTENVLFCNVEASAFSHLRPRRLQFSRTFLVPEASPSGSVWPHRHSYRIVADFEPWSGWRDIAAFESAPLPTINNSGWKVWLSIMRGAVSGSLEAIPGRRFGLEVRVASPWSGHAVNLLKPVLDGAILAFHRHDGRDEAVVVPRLATVLGLPDGEALGYLHRERTAVLGSRRMIWPRGRGLQMNPADDLLDAATIEVSPSPDRAVHISGRLLVRA